MKFQEQFVQSVCFYFKEEGKVWLQKLPQIIRYCEQKWSLKMEDPYHLSINYVAPAKLESGKEVVVKLSIPGADFLDELESLRLFNHQGMVKVNAFDKEKGIIILEKLSPGHTLATVENDELACHEAGLVMKKLSISAPSHTRLQTTAVREKLLRDTVMQNVDGYGPLSSHVLRTSLSLITKLNQSIAQYKLLHGDFHHYNVLASEDTDWVAIDPKGLLGETEYDLIQFLLNKLPEKDVYEVTQKRVDIFTKDLNLDKERLLLWGYCHTVLATSWTVEGDNYDKRFYQMIEIFEKLYLKTYGREIGQYAR
ncbi:hydrogenase expression protein HypB [Bacillus hwajinpoensis]|uniref:Hydrogenase expression protein HypB n=1 Tax=Guptibacillus hwajinpoensis TaxID=208199 RepID=A0A845EXK4_9BACL|nr:aminoglycoside phosphotransferase family protein [Pseudalkalibacillus hwajinpoensis]MYL63243.1 hydrogenase expression protein HypB [Pseudalkalibacillus hwajinpoensis]